MLSKRQLKEVRYNAAQLAEFEGIPLTSQNYEDIEDLAEELFVTTGRYDHEDVYIVICEYLKIFS